ncbi:hypothetical protein LSAT2_026732 [Lamellibrachia satsuma]|nr:hypothetical protein LSAT2_026732 [Lamellibrachia satsuma]
MCFASWPITDNNVLTRVRCGEFIFNSDAFPLTPRIHGSYCIDVQQRWCGPKTHKSHTDEKTMSTTNFSSANVQDEISAADLATQQRSIARRHYSDTGYEQPVATNPRHTYVNAAMIKREAPTDDDYEVM